MLGLDRVIGAGQDGGEAVAAGWAGFGLQLSGLGPGQGHRDGGEGLAVLADDLARDGSPFGLGRQGRGEQRQGYERRQGAQSLFQWSLLGRAGAGFDIIQLHFDRSGSINYSKNRVTSP